MDLQKETIIMGKNIYHRFDGKLLKFIFHLNSSLGWCESLTCIREQQNVFREDKVGDVRLLGININPLNRY